MPMLSLTPLPRHVARAEPSDVEQAPPRGCGWFDSSHELHSGLCVSVHESSDELSALAPLRWWLQWELEGSLPATR